MTNMLKVDTQVCIYDGCDDGAQLGLHEEYCQDEDGSVEGQDDGCDEGVYSKDCMKYTKMALMKGTVKSTMMALMKKLQQGLHEVYDDGCDEGYDDGSDEGFNDGCDEVIARAASIP